MKKTKIILIIILAIAAGAVLYFAYGVAKKRYFSSESGSLETPKSETQNQSVEQPGGTEGGDQGAQSGENTAPQESSLPNISKEDCDNNCAKYKDEADSLKYCQEVCGDIPVTQKNSEEDCANLAGLEKDYCLRDLAVSKKDFSICDRISDGKLKKVCRNRVTEEILN